MLTATVPVPILGSIIPEDWLAAIDVSNFILASPFNIISFKNSVSPLKVFAPSSKSKLTAPYTLREISSITSPPSTSPIINWEAWAELLKILYEGLPLYHSPVLFAK